MESSSLYAVELFGATRLNPSWQTRAGGFEQAQFQIDWSNQTAVCPEGRSSVYWYEHQTDERYSRPVVTVRFNRKECRDCTNRDKCVKSKSGAARSLNLPPQPLYEALEMTRNCLLQKTDIVNIEIAPVLKERFGKPCGAAAFAGQDNRGLQKTYLQEIATATGINLLRRINFLNGKPIAKTRVSRFAKLAH